MVKIIGIIIGKTQLRPNIGMSIWCQNVGMKDKYLMKYYIHDWLYPMMQ